MEQRKKKKQEYMQKNDILVSDLQKKKMKKITFSCCNTANPDCNNIANAFIKRMKVKTVVGFDGSALFDYSDNKLKKGKGSQPTWNTYVERERKVGIHLPGSTPIMGNVPIRKRMGKRTYKNGKWSPIVYY